MKRNQDNSLNPIPEKLWEYKYSYIDLFFPVELYYNYGDIVPEEQIYSNKKQKPHTLQKSANPDVICPCEKLVPWKLYSLSIINYSYVFSVLLRTERRDFS